MGVEYLLLIMAIVQFVLHSFNQMGYNGLYPEWLIKKFKIKNRSWLKKLFFYKEDKYDPYLYITVIPWLISLGILVITLCLYTAFWISPDLLQAFLTSVVSKAIAGTILGFAIVHTLIICILRNMG